MREDAERAERERLKREKDAKRNAMKLVK